MKKLLILLALMLLPACSQGPKKLSLKDFKVGDCYAISESLDGHRVFRVVKIGKYSLESESQDGTLYILIPTKGTSRDITKMDCWEMFSSTVGSTSVK